MAKCVECGGEIAWDDRRGFLVCSLCGRSVKETDPDQPHWCEKHNTIMREVEDHGDEEVGFSIFYICPECEAELVAKER